MRVENENAREFYMQEAVKSQWSTRQLERQINSFFYERLLSSKNKELVAQEIQTLEPTKKPEDVIRDPYVLEFLGLTPNDDFYESDLEQALITHLQKFLLELGRGFSFVARQKRITFDGRHFRIDLVFYNYILKCFVLIDLKVGDLTHQDLGQMQMYVHYYERELMNEGDNPPIGIVLCADKSESVVKYTLPENETQIFASKYKLYLPSEEELLRELSGLDELSSRAMMGEYILYYRGKVFGGIYDDRLLVKPVPVAVKMMPDAEMEPPYDGAKEMILVDNVDDQQFLCELVESMWEELPEKKNIH